MSTTQDFYNTISTTTDSTTSSSQVDDIDHQYNDVTEGHAVDEGGFLPGWMRALFAALALLLFVCLLGLLLHMINK